MTTLLFSTHKLRDILDRKEHNCMAEIASLDENQVLNTPPEGLLDYFVKKYMLIAPEIDEAAIQTDYKDIRIDVSNNPAFLVYDRSRPHYVSGTRFSYFIPYTGEGLLFHCRPSTFNYNPPRATAKDNELIFDYERTARNAEDVSEEFQRDIEELKKYLEWAVRDIGQFNMNFRDKIARCVEGRRKKLLQDKKLAANLGYPLRRRADAPATYITPEVKRRVVPSLPSASPESYKLNPVLDDGEYEHILSVVLNMVLVMERSPQAFSKMEEEDLRQHFLVQLNSQYEGQATGETFNYEGKTDILIRVEGKNIFIAECKFWNGPAGLTEALDQLLSYVSWRDTKTALLLFNRDRNMTTILKRVSDVVKEHPNCKCEHNYEADTGFRYTFGHRDDPGRELLLTVLVFDVPN